MREDKTKEKICYDHPIRSTRTTNDNNTVVLIHTQPKR